MFHKLKSKPHPNPPLEKRGGSLSFPGFLINGMGVVYESQLFMFTRVHNEPLNPISGEQHTTGTEPNLAMAKNER